MSEEKPQQKKLIKTLEEANAEIARLRAEISEHACGNSLREPIAIIGMGCRFPGGVRTPDNFWDLLHSGCDVLGDIPSDRWDVDEHYDPSVAVPGKIYVRKGYYLDNIDQFDPHFFGLSPREAESLDPQQRLVMEVCWETLEHAGIAPSSLKGEKTGVFVGQYWDDYSSQRIYCTDNREIDRYAQLSALRGLTAGRICHILDSHGPAIQLDTACSSSSLAVHLACQSLRNGESNLALAGGVSLILAPEHLIGICQMMALSPDGRCKTFDESADGFGQGEGCGMIALKRLSDAQVDGDNVLAVIHGSAANHDGQARTVTTPSGPAQRAMLQNALTDAGIEPHQVDFVETHGTGTPLGDPIEVSAIGRVFCEDRRKVLYLGAVKANVGHLDSAAGIAGLIKVVLSLQNNTIPPHINFSEPNRHIPWDDWPIKIPTENIAWEGNERFAGISAFGMSGTNVHIIVGSAPEPTTPNEEQFLTSGTEQLLTLSARTEGALLDLAKRYADMISAEGYMEEGSLANLCYSVATGRSHFSHRAAFASSDPLKLARSLHDFASGRAVPTATTGVAGRRAPKLAFLFTGQGAQYVGMGKELYEAHPIFRATLNQCAELFENYLEHHLLEVMWAGEVLHQTRYTQPALFSIEYSLVKLFEEWGIVPDLLLGHSIGEYTAACVAGVVTLKEAVRLVAARGRLMQSLPSGGRMISVMTDEGDAQAAIAEFPTVSIAAVNAPKSIVLSGEGQAVDVIAGRLANRGIKVTELTVSHAFHSPLMEPILDEFRIIVESVDFRPPDITLLSNITGKPWDEAQLSPEYWVEHLREGVRFADGIECAKSKKIETFVEIGPKSTLLGLGRSGVPPDFGTWLPSLRPDREWSTLLSCLRQLYVVGVEINWNSFFPSPGYRRLQLPNYPWQHQRCWTEVVSVESGGARLHPLVHRRIENASKSGIFESRLSADRPAYLNDHRIFGAVVFPASAFFEMALFVANLMFEHDEVVLKNVTVGRALVLSDEPIKVQVITKSNGDCFDFEIFSHPDKSPGGEWIQHTRGTLDRRPPSQVMAINIKEELADFTEPVDIEELSSWFGARGLEYSARFEAIEAIFMSNSGLDDGFKNAMARIRLPAKAVLHGDSYCLHPVITDAGFRIAEAVFQEQEANRVYLPFSISSFSCNWSATGSVWVKVSARQQIDNRVVDLQLFDESGKLFATVEELVLRPVSLSSLKSSVAKLSATGESLGDWLYHRVWEETALSESAVQAGNWLLLSDNSCISDALFSAMRVAGHRVYIATSEDDACKFLSSKKAQGLNGVLHLWGMNLNEEHPDSHLLASLKVIQTGLKNNVSGKNWFVTKGAQAVLRDDTVSPWQSQFWGFGRTLQVESPERFGGCVDLDLNAEKISNEIEMLTGELCCNSGETEIAFRKEARHVARLVKLKLSETLRPSPELKSDSSYLITGGMGALGLQVAKYLATHGAGHLVLVSRSGVSSADQRVALQAIEATGVRVDVVSVDIGKAEDVRRLLATLPRLRGIVHAAGVLADGMLMQQSLESFKKVAVPKVRGAWLLHTQTQDQPMDFFVLFSSVASIIGSLGQSNYAASNAFMDGLAHLRRGQGLPASAINWGPWADVGMAASDAVMQRLIRDGWQPMHASQGCDYMGRLLTKYDLPQAAVLPIDWQQFIANTPGANQWSTIRHCISKEESNSLVDNLAEVAAKSVKDANSEQRIDLISSYLLIRIAQTLRVPDADLNEFAKLGELGIDSLNAVEVQIWVKGDLGVELPVEKLFTASSIKDLATVIDQLLLGAPSVATLVRDRLPSNESRWVTCSNSRPAAKLRLFCFPYAGGGSSAFNSWSKAFPEEVEVCVIQMPGREERLGETLIRDMPKLVDTLAQEINAFSGHPFAFFGHSMGAIVCYETARRLSIMRATQPVHLFLSARAAPHLQEKGDALRFLDDEAFVGRLQKTYGAVPEAIMQSAELKRVFLPILRADVELLETYEETSSEPLECPITALGGASDPAISKAKLAGWQSRTSAKFTNREFQGKHFFIDEEGDAVMAAIIDDLSHSL